MRALLILAAFTGLQACSLRAQFTSPPPSRAECDSAVAIVGALDLSASNAGYWHRIDQCGAAGARPLAGAILALKEEQDWGRLDFLSAALTLQDADIFAALLSVAGNPGASSPARTRAFNAAVLQFDPKGSVTSTFTTAETAEDCGIPVPGADSPPHFRGTPLPIDAGDQLYLVARAVERDSAAPNPVRSAARCSMLFVASRIPVPVNTALIRLSYICGNRFRVQNGNPEGVQLSYEVPETSERGSLGVLAESDHLLSTRRPGTVRLFHRGQLIQTTENGGTACR